MKWVKAELPDDLHQWLRTRALKQGQTLGETINDLLGEAQRGNGPTDEQRREAQIRAGAIINRIPKDRPLYGSDVAPVVQAVLDVVIGGKVDK